jgi:methionyl-tRNA synthetase
MDWGIPVPVEDSSYDDKVLYVWYEAVIGYLSATIEWAANEGDPEAWRDWWYNPAARTLYFIGKDNIPFHTVFWPAQLLGSRGLYSDNPAALLNLPYDVPANEFMNMEGEKISGSRNWGVWMLDALQRYEPDPLRYYLTTNMPETRDSDWSWAGFVERNNNELVANWGNLVNRVLSMTQRYFGGVVQEPGELTPADQALLAAVDEGFATAAEFYDGCKFRAAVGEALRLSTLVNQYLEETSPWTAVKADPAAAGRVLNVALQAINGLKIIWSPVLPFTSQALHEMLGEEGALFGESVIRHYDETTRGHLALTYDAGAAAGRWERATIPAGRQLPEPRPLFKKLEPEVVERELALLGPKPNVG